MNYKINNTKECEMKNNSNPKLKSRGKQIQRVKATPIYTKGDGDISILLTRFGSQ